MAELMMKDTGSCRGAGGSMHIFDRKNTFRVDGRSWRTVAYACGAAKSILLDRAMGLSDDVAKCRAGCHGRPYFGRLCGNGAQNGRMAELLNSAAKDNLPLLVIVIDNGRAIILLKMLPRTATWLGVNTGAWTSW
jgi:pyruvate dehydrogenase E1 component alpha subunit